MRDGNRKLSLFVLGLILHLPPAISGEKPVVDPTRWVLTDPQTFDLQIPRDTFIGRLSSDKSQRVCHTQGLEVTDDSIFIACCLYDQEKRAERSLRNEGFLLKAPLLPLLSEGHPRKGIWQISPITQRISQTGLPLGHPSGLALDAMRKVVWFAPSVYGAHSFSKLLFYNMGSSRIEDPSILIKDHLGAVVPVLRQFLIGLTWNSERFLILDILSGKSRLITNRLEEKIDYQDCAAVTESLFLCSGNLVSKAGETNRRTGRIHILEVNGGNLESLHIRLKGKLPARHGEGSTGDLGIREFIVEDGRAKEIANNRYGPYESPLTLTNEGFSLSPDFRYAYFLPEDLPEARLIRYRITSSSP